MELFLQFGHGMKALTIELSKKWGSASVILSPRDMSPHQLGVWSNEFENNNVKTYFDPQCYYPQSTHLKLSQYAYWDNDLVSNLKSNPKLIQKHIQSIKDYNDIAKTQALLLPCVLNPFNDNEQWLESLLLQLNLYNDAAHRIESNKPIIATLAIPKEILLGNEIAIGQLVQKLEGIEVDGFYLVAEANNHEYLQESPQWLSNVLYLSAALKLSGKKVFVGYSNHQLLPLILAKTDAMASGTWQNVRSFTNRFVDAGELKRKSTWVYYPESFSEYKVVFLDWAYNKGVLSLLQSKDKEYSTESIKKLFCGSNLPSMTGFSETDAFFHYLCCLNHQISIIDKKSYDDAYNGYELLLTVAEREIEKLEKNGIFAGVRSFKEYLDVNRAAINQFNKNFGFQMKMSWQVL